MPSRCIPGGIRFAHGIGAPVLKPQENNADWFKLAISCKPSYFSGLGVVDDFESLDIDLGFDTSAVFFVPFRLLLPLR
jgi:hypothetical protein